MTASSRWRSGLQVVEATIFARAQGVDVCPKIYEGVPVAVDPFRASVLRGRRPGRRV